MRKRKELTLATKATEAEHAHWMRCAELEGMSISGKLRVMLVKEYGLPEQKEAKTPVVG